MLDLTYDSLLIDVTRAEFKTKRTTNPLNPSYVVRDEDGKVSTVGEIEGCKPCTLPPERKRGPLSNNLNTHDIDGAKSSTKGLGAFAFHVSASL